MGGAEQLAGRRLERGLADEHLGGDADDPVGLADLGERIGDRRRRPEHEQLRRHHPAGGALLVGQQAAHDVGVLGVHGLEDAPLLLAGHLAEQVGEVVVLHLVEHADEAVEVEALDDAHLLLLGQLLEHVGQALVVHRRGELAALGQREGADDAGDLGRVHVAQAGRLGGDLADRREQPGHLVGVDEAVARPAAQHVAAHEADLGDLPPLAAPVLDRRAGRRR